MLISDQGSNLLTSKEVQQLLQFYSIQRHITVPYHPASHGSIESAHVALSSLVRQMIEQLDNTNSNLTGQNVDRLLPHVQGLLNSKPLPFLEGHSPYFLMFGCEDSFQTARLTTRLFVNNKEVEESWRRTNEILTNALTKYRKRLE